MTDYKTLLELKQQFNAFKYGNVKQKIEAEKLAGGFIDAQINKFSSVPRVHSSAPRSELGADSNHEPNAESLPENTQHEENLNKNNHKQLIARLESVYGALKSSLEQYHALTLAVVERQNYLHKEDTAENDEQQPSVCQDHENHQD